MRDGLRERRLEHFDPNVKVEWLDNGTVQVTMSGTAFDRLTGYDERALRETQAFNYAVEQAAAKRKRKRRAS